MLENMFSTSAVFLMPVSVIFEGFPTDSFFRSQRMNFFVFVIIDKASEMVISYHFVLLLMMCSIPVFHVPSL